MARILWNDETTPQSTVNINLRLVNDIVEHLRYREQRKESQRRRNGTAILVKLFCVTVNGDIVARLEYLVRNIPAQQPKTNWIPTNVQQAAAIHKNTQVYYF